MVMNGYNLAHRFFDWAFSHREDFKPTVSALYFYLIEVCNKLGWKPEFSISAKECMEGMGVSGYNTVIETINDELKNICQIEHSRHRGKANFLMNLISGIAAYCLFDKKPSIKYEIEDTYGQLTLFG